MFALAMNLCAALKPCAAPRCPDPTSRTATPQQQFTQSKSVAAAVTPAAIAAMTLPSVLDTWTIQIDGLVERPFNITLASLLSQVHVEERVYRHRCVEAWSIVVPWIGFPLRRLVEIAKPLGQATHVRFETYNNASVMPGVARAPNGLGAAPWPYVEGVTMQEARPWGVRTDSFHYLHPLLHSPVSSLLHWRGDTLLRSARRPWAIDLQRRLRAGLA